jgi:hypothetical protein
MRGSSTRDHAHSGSVASRLIGPSRIAQIVPALEKRIQGHVWTAPSWQGESSRRRLVFDIADDGKCARHELAAQIAVPAVSPIAGPVWHLVTTLVFAENLVLLDSETARSSA